MTDGGATDKPAILIPRDALMRRVSELAAAISRDHEGREIVVICTLGGATIFYGDLVRQLTVPAHHQFLGFSSYQGRSSASGEVRITLDLSEPIEGRHVVVLEGTIVSGRTPAYIMEVLRLRAPASVKLCTLLLKRKSLRVPLEPDYVGFEIDEEGMAVGYGMGHSPAERGLPYIATVPVR